jgi:HNH endonuclease
MANPITALFDNEIVQSILMDRCIPEPNSGCWLWLPLGRHNVYGYAFFQGRYYAAHRLSYAVFKGDVPADRDVCHTCDTPACINPDHLFLGTEQDNIRDMLAKGRSNRKGERHQRWQGSKLTEENVRLIRQSDESSAALARQFGVSPSAVKSARAGKTWSHLTAPVPEYAHGKTRSENAGC